MHISKALSKKAHVMLLFAGCMLASLSVTFAQTEQAGHDNKADKKALIKELIDSQNYVFQAQTAMSTGGRVRNLTSEYDLTVGKDAIVSYLPYFGRAYSAPLDPSQGGIQFTSKDFSYTSTPGKKGGWNILIKPKDGGDVQQMSLSISDEGYSTLQVISTSKQPITFNGVIAPRRPKRK